MIWLLIISLLVLGVVVFCVIYAKKFNNPYKLIMIFGKKGSGKTTLLTKFSQEDLEDGWTCYSTIDVPGCITFDVNKIAEGYVFPPESAIFIDEVGMIWDNRNYKQFKESVRDYFKLQRHYRNKVYLFSQTFDVDVKLRNLTDAMYLCTCHMGFISIARKIKRDIMIVEATGESESRIADSLEFVPIWLSLFGANSLIFTFIPKWAKYFDSHETPAKPFVLGEPRPALDCPGIKTKFENLIFNIRERIHIPLKKEINIADVEINEDDIFSWFYNDEEESD